MNFIDCGVDEEYYDNRVDWVYNVILLVKIVLIVLIF